MRRPERRPAAEMPGPFQAPGLLVVRLPGFPGKRGVYFVEGEGLLRSHDAFLPRVRVREPEKFGGVSVAGAPCRDAMGTANCIMVGGGAYGRKNATQPGP